MKALVIGASGHLGAHLTRVLQNEGHSVRAFVRPTSDLRGLQGIDLDVFRGTLAEPAALAAAVEGCDEVYHLAAPTERQPGAQTSIVGGTRNVLEACRNGRVARLVYTSSIVTVGYSSSQDIILDEATNQRTDATTYHSAKWLAEREVLSFAATHGLPVVVVNPATIVGSLDYRVTPSNAVIQRCMDHGLRLAVTGGLTVTHAEDVARGLALAMRRGQPGERYILGGDRVVLSEYFSLIADECGRPRPLLTLPRIAVMAGGACFSIVERLSGRPMPFSFSQARLLSGKYGWYSSDKAIRELGYRFRPVAEAVRDYVTWVRRHRPAHV